MKTPHTNILKMAVTTFNRHESVTPSDSTVFSEVSSIYVGVSGDLALVLVGSSTSVTYIGVAAGSFLPLNVVKVLSTGTTATSIIRGFN